MTSDDESLIRDKDLRKKLEIARGTFVFDVTVRQLAREQEKRDKLAALPRSTRRRLETAETIATGEYNRDDIRHIHSILAICGLPYERLPEGQTEWERRHGRMALDVTAGFLRDTNGNKIYQPIPFGPKPRLILTHLCSEAIRQKNPEIEISETFTAFVRDMGFSTSGGKRGPLTAFKEQLNALAACTMKLSAWTGKSVTTEHITPIRRIDLWLASNPDQQSLWASKVTFSTEMYESLLQHSLPLNKQVLKAFAGSARKLDIYAWLGWRMYNLDKPLHLSWQNLRDQFGAAYTRERDFRARFARELNEIHDVLTKLPFTLTETGMQLLPADPAVLALPAPRSRDLKKTVA